MNYSEGCQKSENSQGVKRQSFYGIMRFSTGVQILSICACLLHLTTLGFNLLLYFPYDLLL